MNETEGKSGETMIRTRSTGSGEPRQFDVDVQDGGGETHYQVTMSQATFERLSDGKATPEACVHAAFLFLLDREPKDSILRRFDIAVIERYFPNSSPNSPLPRESAMMTGRTELPCIMRVAASAIALIAAGVLTASASAQQTTRYIGARVPIVGRSVEIGAVRATTPSRSETPPSLRPANSWSKLATLPNATVHDVAFESATVGYAAAELGQVWKTKDGGNSWREILNQDFPIITTESRSGIARSSLPDSTTATAKRSSPRATTAGRAGRLTWC